MTNTDTLADGRDGEAMEGWIGHELLFLGLPIDVMANLTRAAAGAKPEFLMALAQAAMELEGVSLIGRLALAETPALMAALIGGETERRFLAEHIEAQADVATGDDRRGCLLQALSVWETLNDSGAEGAAAEKVRLLSMLEAAA